MPKKRTYNFKQLQGKPSSPQSAAGQRNGDSSGSPSVNQRLSELRKLEAREATAKKRELADQVNQRSVPPQVQGILGVPASAPPKSKPGVRTRERLRTPGPAPPKSWITGGSSWSPALAMSLKAARRGLKKSANRTERSRPMELLRFARLAGLEDFKQGDGARSLTHITLKAIAESWDLFDEDDYPAFADIPLRLRLRLISYISSYGPPANSAGIEALLQGTEIVEQLDLASLIGHGNLTMKKLSKLLKKAERSGSAEAGGSTVESWDLDESFNQYLQFTPQLNRAAHLTHLCLSHPGSGVSWRDLLSFSKSTPHITHLSLAYWPWPTLTPNLATTTVSGQHGPSVNASASDYYAAYDQNLEEPTILLRQLSNHLLCLQWLDLEGCQQWSPALAELAKSSVPGNRTQDSPVSHDGWNTQQTDAPVLATNWKNLSYLRLFQGWLPSYWGMRSLNGASIPVSAMEVLVSKGIMYHLEHSSDRSTVPPEELTHDRIDVEKKRARNWLAAESRISHASLRISLARSEHACKAIRMDYGWDTIASFLRAP